MCVLLTIHTYIHFFSIFTVIRIYKFLIDLCQFCLFDDNPGNIEIYRQSILASMTCQTSCLA